MTDHPTTDHPATSRSSDQSIGYEGSAIVWQTRFPGWLRPILVSIVLFPLPFIGFYVANMREVDWADPPVLGLLIGTFGFVIAPLGFAGFMVWMGLFGASERLCLDPARGEAVYERVTPWRRHRMRYPLAEVRLGKVELERDHPVHDTSYVALRLPDGRKVRMSPFFRDTEAEAWVAELGRVLSDR